MEISKMTFCITVLVSLTVGGYLGYSLRPGINSEYATSVASNLPRSETLDDVMIQQDGQNVTLTKFFSVFRQNPNRFNFQTEKSKFTVRGKIASISESNDVLDQISGFHIPLKHSPSVEFGSDRGPDLVSMFVKGFSKQEIALLNVGDALIADCPKVRAFNESLVFDDCIVRKEAK